MSIVRINYFQAADGQAAALREFLFKVIELVREAPGCQEVQLLTEPEQASRLVIVETWDSVAAHQAAASRVPSEILAAVRPLLDAPPIGTYYERLG